MLRKRSHQAFTDLETEEPLSPIARPLHQEMGAGGSDSDGDEVMGTGVSAFLYSQPCCAILLMPVSCTVSAASDMPSTSRVLLVRLLS